MTKTSQQIKYTELLKEIAINDFLMLELYGKDAVNQRKKEDEMLEGLTIALSVAEYYRCDVPTVRDTIPKPHKFLTSVLPTLDENAFRQMVRLSWTNFKYVLELIKDDKLFRGPGSHQQLPVEMQLMIVLYRLGISGKKGSFSKISNFFKIGDEASIQLKLLSAIEASIARMYVCVYAFQAVTERIFKAILKLTEKFLYWPDAVERDTLVSETLHELPHCIGYVGSTAIRLEENPHENYEEYFSQKHGMFILKAQAVCDYKLRIRQFMPGYPGGMSDASIYNDSNLSTNPQEFMQGVQWLAGNSAYKLTDTVITPFTTNPLDCTLQRCADFNRTFNKYRIRIDQCFDMLKARFRSLNELKVNIKNDDSIRFACRWILVCAILHNIVMERNEPGDIFEMSAELVDGLINDELEVNDDNYPTAEGEAKRRALMEIKQELNV